MTRRGWLLTITSLRPLNGPIALAMMLHQWLMEHG
jgi:hypothetical protein